MKTKYDWSNISKQVKFIIIDDDGTEYHLKKKPKFGLSNRYKTGVWFFNKSSIFAWFDYKHANSDGAYPDFADSLEERPNEN